MTLLAVGVLTATAGAVVVGVRRTLVAELDGTLTEILRTEIASSSDAPAGQAHLHRLGNGAAEGYERLSEIRDEDGGVVLRIGPLAERGPLVLAPDVVRRALEGETVLGSGRCGSAPCRFAIAPHPLRSPTGRRLVLIVALSTEPIDEAHRALIATFGIALGLAALAAAASARGLSRRLLQPLERIATDARAIGEANTGGRIAEVSPDQEFRSLVAILNGMLSRLDAAFAAQRRFVADASHELRSPLANLRGTIEVALRRTRNAEEYSETLTVALREAERLSRLVDDLLTLSRADAGRVPLDLDPTDLGRLAGAAVEAHRSRADAAGICIALDAPRSVVVRGDADRLREAVDNLLDNALRYAPRSSRVDVRVAEESGQGVLSVSDSGPGLTAEDRVHVFERFYRADSSRARASGGLGLGLAIVHAILEAHGGSVEVESEAGRGALFRIRLPLVPANGLGGAAAGTRS